MSQSAKEIYEPETGLTPAGNEGSVDNEPEDEPVVKPKRKKKPFIIAAVLLLLVAAVAFRIINCGNQASAQDINYVNHIVGTHDITLELSGTGSLSPADSYTVTTLISGEILDAPFEEGDIVDKDALLYQVDSSDVASSIEQAENALEQTRRNHDQRLKNLEDLNIKATTTGTVVELLVEVGDKVSNGMPVAVIRDNAVMSLVIPFGSDDAAGFTVGQSAEVTLDGSFERLNGTISKISAVDDRLDGNMLVRQVTIDVSNPGGISSGQAATAMVGDIACNGSGVFSLKAEATVTAGAAGEVSAIHIDEGSRVTKNQTIISLSSTSLENEIANSQNSLRDSEISLQNRYDQLDNYTIKSPISGTIIEKSFKEGDTLSSGKTLCTIFDLSYLTMTLNIDELDIAQVEVGQEVTVTAEALPGKTYKGYVTKVNINGTTSGGTTSYPVTIRIDETDGLLPGMNVQASIVVTSKKDVVAIPVSALSRGNRVLVQTSAAPGGEVSEMTERPNMAGRPNMSQGQNLQDEQIQSFPGGQSFTAAQPLTIGESGLPEGFEYIQVTPGISDGAFIEITDGLKAGDIIAYAEDVLPESQSGFFMGGPMGGATMSGPAMGGSTAIYTERSTPIGGNR